MKSLFVFGLRYLLKARKLKFIEIKLKKKWNFVFSSIQKGTIFNKKNLKPNSIAINNHFG